MTYVTLDHVEAFATIDQARAEAMIEGAEAMAVMAAPCLGDPGKLTATHVAAVRAILLRAILRWHESGTGSQRTTHTQSSGPFSETQGWESSGSRGLFWPSEIADLQAVCRQVSGGPTALTAFSVDTAPGFAPAHSPICALAFGALYCSCGSDLNRLEGPIYEVVDP